MCGIAGIFELSGRREIGREPVLVMGIAQFYFEHNSDVHPYA